jgi:ammonia channel protein AmtB
MTADQQQTSLQSEENVVRKKVAHSLLYLFFFNTYSTILIFFNHLVTIECIVSVLLSTGLTTYIHYLILERNDNDTSAPFDGSIMSWTLLSFAIITPISASVTMAFRRREIALQHIATIRSTLLSVYSAHAIWDWDWKTDTNTGIRTTGRDRVRDFTGLLLRRVFYYPWWCKPQTKIFVLSIAL